MFLFVTVSFLCPGSFRFVLERYGLVQACLAGAGIFLIATLLAAMSYAIQKRQEESKPKALLLMMQTALSDPMVLAAGLQIVRTVGIKRLIPYLRSPASPWASWQAVIQRQKKSLASELNLGASILFDPNKKERELAPLFI